MKRYVYSLLLAAVLGFLLWMGAGCLGNLIFTSFSRYHETVVSDLSARINRAHFRADSWGRAEDYQLAEQLQLKLASVYRDQSAYRLLRTLRTLRLVRDPIRQRELTLLLNDYECNRIDPALLEQVVRLQTSIEQVFAGYRPQWQGRRVSNRRIGDVLKSSTNESQLCSAWGAGVGIGKVVEDDLLRLVKIRNRAARELGYPNYFVMQMTLSEENPADIDRLFNRFDNLTRGEYRQQKEEMDRKLAARYHVAPEDLKPWHYQQVFLQEVPECCSIDLDPYYAGRDVVKVVADFYARAGLPAVDVVQRSDFYERAGKYPYAYCVDIDRCGDIRVLANIHDDASSTETLLHEFGHAIYDKGIDNRLPWRLREPAQICTTEAVAMMFARFYTEPDWLREELGLDSKEAVSLAAACRNTTGLNSLIFSRWALVVYNFEKAMYENPDQDLDSLWWDLVEKYQMIKRPPGNWGPVWAAKVHLATAPVYYHNYLLGEMMAYQLKEHLGCLATRPGKEWSVYLTRNLFAPGALYPWDELVKRACGENLDPVYMIGGIKTSPVGRN